VNRGKSVNQSSLPLAANRQGIVKIKEVDIGRPFVFFVCASELQNDRDVLEEFFRHRILIHIDNVWEKDRGRDMNKASWA